MSNKPSLIGVTGGIGSGKSTVCKIFEVLGHQVYYADDRAKWLMQNEPSLINEIKGLFGEMAYKDNRLDRTFIAEQVFKNEELLTKLNGLVHPAVADDLKRWAATHQKERILFDEAALLFDNGSYKKMDKMILVVAPEELRIERVVARDPHRTSESVKEIINNQMSDEQKSELTDFIIYNDGRSSLIKQVMELYPKLL